MADLLAEVEQAISPAKVSPSVSSLPGRGSPSFAHMLGAASPRILAAAAAPRPAEISLPAQHVGRCEREALRLMHELHGFSQLEQQNRAEFVGKLHEAMSRTYALPHVAAHTVSNV
jgi:hypothetical protein